jgi:hypothetical protein
MKFSLLGKLLHEWENEVTKTRQDVDDKERGCRYKTVVGYNAMKGNAYFGSL